MRDPQTPEEWQEAVNGACVMLMVDSARQYGLVFGGPEVNVERCDELLARGKQLGVVPDENEALIQFIRSLE
jgi:hypothetical protein